MCQVPKTALPELTLYSLSCPACTVNGDTFARFDLSAHVTLDWFIWKLVGSSAHVDECARNARKARHQEILKAIHLCRHAKSR